ncbi:MULTISPECIES: hypothetical protein [Clostridium]|jgi:hypothetical protein|uniref:Uncharacterized protein n=2 Tax=Clostridium TaxID=1485 RepID=A0A151AQE8_9CLOT|nr:MULTISPECIES: hypothetical protein [Clostridium]MBE6078958.1 hypothetical protein [Clostridium lundense]KYH29800.1 hypothetical protein CLCOL_04380 [Clostridium colicanis DSM 13634]MBE6042741.1 hypothetical protein [Clostridium thermopalmarium]PRR75181.1 hypothetical protein CPAL_07330 [Clostridium thermopalmarium DSM 5974]PVZ27937.1 hypothetical protein LX19_00476 [Clostridium thermopalmarium DSM 5974]
MCRLKTNKGYILLEAVFSIILLSLVLSFIFSMEMRNINLKKYNLEINKYAEFLEGLKNTLIFNKTYEDIKNIAYEGENLNDESCATKKLYINNENINLDVLKNKEFSEIITFEKPNKLPYLEIKVHGEPNNVIKLNLNLIFRLVDETNNISTSFYKGDY